MSQNEKDNFNPDYNFCVKLYLFPEFPKGLYYKTGQGHC